MKRTFSFWAVAAVTFGIVSDAHAIEFDELTKCRAVTDVAARAACYDKLVDGAVSTAATSPRPVTSPSRPAPVPEERSVQISKVSVGANNRLVLVTTDGEIWAQVEGQLPPKDPAPGASMTIHRGSLGGFFCELDSHTSFRCKLRNR